MNTECSHHIATNIRTGGCIVPTLQQPLLAEHLKKFAGQAYDSLEYAKFWVKSNLKRSTA